MFGLSYAPIMKALSKLLELPENAIAKEARKLLGDGLKGMSEGWHEITSVRRVLVREFVRSDIQPYLYSYEFTHNEIFGGESIETQVAKAVDEAKKDKAFIHKPAFRSTSGSCFQVPPRRGFVEKGTSTIYAAWCKVTTNKFVLRIVRDGYKLQFSSHPVQYSYTPRNFSSYSLPITKAKVEELFFEGALKIVSPSEDQYLSRIFPVLKRTPGEFRIIFVRAP